MRAEAAASPSKSETLYRCLQFQRPLAGGGGHTNRRGYHGCQESGCCLFQRSASSSAQARSTSWSMSRSSPKPGPLSHRFRLLRARAGAHHPGRGAQTQTRRRCRWRGRLCCAVPRRKNIRSHVRNLAAESPGCETGRGLVDRYMGGRGRGGLSEGRGLFSAPPLRCDYFIEHTNAIAI